MNPRSSHGGRHELGQNFLRHQPTVDLIVDLVARTSGSILEIGAGDGALTVPLAGLGRDLLAIDVDEHQVRRLARRLPHVAVQRRDVLSTDLSTPVIVGNIPFHLTTPVLRRLLAARGWASAILLLQWEVARKRAGVGGATMMTAQHWPWFTFELRARVPAERFWPVPSVDGGLLLVTRRDQPLVPTGERGGYQDLVRAVFTGPGSGIAGILRRLHPDLPTDELLVAAAVDRQALPRNLTAEQWSSLWVAIRSAARRPTRRTGSRRRRPG
ncbi:23S ribosomal RNA methyltransferase Erm [Nocardioides pantholopis]|uniref:23S ribosomal RNA methyltransferase Erm n=1 Tax=Nocardioides pantholopis TaxID=2483798 RepID=UPI000F093746|nr:23S ribosomal RNA methyltransferase Erm [Nocardioides pantholopis]